MDRVIVDTSAWIEALRRGGDEVIRNAVARLLKHSVILMPGIIRAELLRGTKTKNEFEELSGLLDGLEYLPMDEPFWDRLAGFSFDLFRKGITVPFVDTCIALLTIESKAKLLHYDKHFELIARHSPLSILRADEV